MPSKTAPIQFRAAESGLADALSARSKEGRREGATAARDLTRYYTLLERELRRVALTREEAWLLLDVGNGTLFQPEVTSTHLVMEVEDSFADGSAEKWGVDGPALLKKLLALSAAQHIAVMDAIERFWLLPETERGEEALTRLGLLRGTK